MYRQQCLEEKINVSLSHQFYWFLLFLYQVTSHHSIKFDTSRIFDREEQRFKEKELLGEMNGKEGNISLSLQTTLRLPHYQSYPRTKWIRF